MQLRSLLALSAFLCASMPVVAADIEAQSPWVRGTVAGQKATGAFMTLTSKQDAVLVGASVSSKIAGVVEVHEMKMEGDRMVMRALPRLELPAGKPVELARGGYHIMLMGLKKQLKPGETVTLSLKIESAGQKVETVKVKAKVRDLTETLNDHSHHHHH